MVNPEGLVTLASYVLGVVLNHVKQMHDGLENQFVLNLACSDGKWISPAVMMAVGHLTGIGTSWKLEALVSGNKRYPLWQHPGNSFCGTT